MKTLHLKIYGRVQGVLFRHSAREKMKEWGLKGWIRNCDDGCVETEVEGEEGAVEKYRAWCKSGPRGARVERIENF
ncbi:acylphosphatase [Candidatus Uhrbacteria bacterium]|nr:acylphosphatase [Candidatus Uhrbacteria bacterium]